MILKNKSIFVQIVRLSFSCNLQPCLFYPYYSTNTLIHTNEAILNTQIDKQFNHWKAVNT